MTTVKTSRFGAWLRGVDTFAAQLLLLERDVDVCDLAAAEAEDDADAEDDPDGDEADEQDEPAPAAASQASAGRDSAPADDAGVRAAPTA